MCVTQRTLGLTTVDPKGQRNYEQNQHGSSRQKRPGCLGDEENNGDVASFSGESEKLVPSTWQEGISAPALASTHDRITGVGPTPFTPAAIK